VGNRRKNYTSIAAIDNFGRMVDYHTHSMKWRERYLWMVLVIAVVIGKS
jgi:hypothetical protein